ncbi:MAG: hypothetical protein AAB393_15015 [Bacteroidota bacterium]
MWGQTDPSDWKSLFKFHRKPTLSLYYGWTTSSLNGLTRSFASPGFAELGIGGTRIDIEDETILWFRYDYLSLTNISNTLGGSSSSSRIITDLWRVGPTWEKGFGYRLGEEDSPALFLDHAGGLKWSRLHVKENLVHPGDSALLGQYDDAFRFGMSTEAGVRFRFSDMVMLNAGYERALVFRRHIFWRWVGSLAIEGSAQWLVGSKICVLKWPGSS